MNFYKTDGGRQSSGFFAEKKDCTVRSFAVAADIPYADAHLLAKRSGRKDGKGWWSERILAVAAKDGLLAYSETPCMIPGPRYTVRYPTVAQVISRRPTGRYIITTHNHAFAVIDGVIHDTGLLGIGCRVRQIFEVKPKTVAPAITQAQVSELWERLNKLEAR
jgi:hypothetical protein